MGIGESSVFTVHLSIMMRLIVSLVTLIALSLPLTARGAKASSTYLALGDSITVGTHVDGSVVYPGDRACSSPAIDASGEGGWTCLFLAKLRQQDPTMQIQNLALDGEDSCSFTTRKVCGQTRRSVGSAGALSYNPATTSQLKAALRYLHQNPHGAKIISFEIGGNDLLSLAIKNPLQGIPHVPSVLLRTERNYDHILAKLRRAAPHATIVLVDLYNPLSGDSSSLAMRGVNVVLDSVTEEYALFVRAEAARYHAIFVDLLPTFHGKAPTYIGTDHIHPSNLGQQQLANRVWSSYKASRR